MRILYAILCLVAIPGIFLASKDTLTQHLSNPEIYWPLGIGVAIYFMFYGIRSRGVQHNFKWFQVFSHELTHVLFSLLTFNRIHGFNATSHAGGYVAYQGKTNMLILLSPYCIPIFTLFIVLIAGVFGAQSNPYLIGSLGFTYIFHLHTFAIQADSKQPDFKPYGLLTSYVFIIMVNLLMVGLIIGSTGKGLMIFKDFLLMSWNYSMEQILVIQSSL